MRALRLAALALLAAPAIAACQTGSGTVIVVDRSRVAVNVEPATFTGEPGDTVTFTAFAIDTISGDTIQGVLRWSSADSTGVSIDATTGHATLLRAGTFEVFADLMEIVGLIITAEQDDGSFREVFQNSRRAIYAATGVVPDTLQLVTGETRQLCAYLEDAQGNHYRCTDCAWSSGDPSIVSVVDGGPSAADVCPTWTPGMPFPTPARPEPFELEALRRVGVRVG